MNDEKNYQSSNEGHFAEAKQLLSNKQIMAHILQYVVPSYHDLPIDYIAKQISYIEEHKNRWYDITCEMPIRGKKAGLVLFIAGNGSSVDDYNEGEHPFGSDEDTDHHVPRIVHMITLKHKANDSEIGHDTFYTLIEELLDKKSEVPEKQFLGNSVFYFAELRFNQSKKLNGVHRLLQVIFSDIQDKKELLKMNSV